MLEITRSKKKSRNAAIVLAVFCSAFFVYANSLGNGFVWDDHILIEGDVLLRENPVGLARRILGAPFQAQIEPIVGGARPVV
ncbi:MAG: hypothetical protein COV48_02900, partial [Elusimicrobia bacterium CG11_big_fil_rev_8_21_14_0_20_64_6]